MYHMINVLIGGDGLHQRDVIRFPTFIDRQQPTDRLDKVFAIVLKLVKRCPMFGACVSVSPSHHSGSQSSHTLYALVTRPRSGSMKCKRCDGVADAASMTPA